MFKILIILFLIFLYKFLKGTSVDIASFFKKGLEPLDDRHAVWVCHGRQGSGKNYIAVYELLKQDKNIVNKIKTNIHSLKIKDYKIEYFTKI